MPITQTLSCDRFAVYFCNRVVEGADPRTVWLLPPMNDYYFRDHAAFYCNDFGISAEDYYKHLEERVAHYAGLLKLFKQGSYFSSMFRRSVPKDVKINDE